MCGLSVFMFASPVSLLLQAGTWTKSFCRNSSSLQWCKEHREIRPRALLSSFQRYIFSILCECEVHQRMAEVTLVIDIVVSICDYPIPSALTTDSVCVLHWSLILLTTSEKWPHQDSTKGESFSSMTMYFFRRQLCKICSFWRLALLEVANTVSSVVRCKLCSLAYVSGF